MKGADSALSRVRKQPLHPVRQFIDTRFRNECGGARSKRSVLPNFESRINDDHRARRSLAYLRDEYSVGLLSYCDAAAFEHLGYEVSRFGIIQSRYRSGRLCRSRFYI